MNAERIAEILSEHFPSPARTDNQCHKCWTFHKPAPWPCETYELASLAAEAEKLREVEKIAREWIEAGDAFVQQAIAGPPSAASTRPLLRIKDKMRRVLAAAALETGAQG